jgi:hypothetical protein
MVAAVMAASAAGAQSVAQSGPSHPASANNHSSSTDSAAAQFGQVLGTWSFAPFVAGGVRSPTGVNWGMTPDRAHFFVGLHMATPVLRVGPLMLMYAPNWVPVIVISNNPKYHTVTTAGVARKVEYARGAVYGTGLVPFGLQGEARLTNNVDIYSMAGLGGAWFSDFMPQDGARRFNFSIEFGGGFLVGTQHRRAWQIGYKFHHFSNMYTARENPGVDGHVFYVGMRWQKRLPR